MVPIIEDMPAMFPRFDSMSLLAGFCLVSLGLGRLLWRVLFARKHVSGTFWS